MLELSDETAYAFVERTTTPGSPDFVPIPERIAASDNDGTLWSEQPAYFQLAFAILRAKMMAAHTPGLSENALLSALASGDPTDREWATIYPGQEIP